MVVVFGCVAAVVYFSSNTIEKATFMAKQEKRLDERVYQNLVCAPRFRQEIAVDLARPECLPQRCGRFVADDLVSERDAHDLLQLAKRGLAKGGSEGGASILDLHSGALSKGQNFVNIYKMHPDLFGLGDFKLYNEVKDRVRRAIEEHFGVNGLKLSHPTFFSRLTAKEAVTPHDEYWHEHVDKDTYPSFHFTSLLYLTDKNVDFEGGGFVFVQSEDRINRTVEPRVGRVSAFTSGPENRHHVQKVTSGTRYALTMGFTCDPEKAIQDPPGDHLKT